MGGRAPVAGRDQNDRERAEQLGGCRMTGSTPISEGGTKQPDECQMIGKAPNPQKDPSARKALGLGNLTLCDTK